MLVKSHIIITCSGIWVDCRFLIRIVLTTWQLFKLLRYLKQDSQYRILSEPIFDGKSELIANICPCLSSTLVNIEELVKFIVHKSKYVFFFTYSILLESYT